MRARDQTVFPGLTERANFDWSALPICRHRGRDHLCIVFADLSQAVACVDQVKRDRDDVHAVRPF